LSKGGPRVLRPDARIAPELIQHQELLLEEGHCFRHQALAVCHQGARGANMLGASSLSTLVQMVASGFGVTLLPEISTGFELAHSGIRLIRFTEPEPTRMLGLAWRRSSPRKAEFRLLGELVTRVWEV
ncbi:MAG: LysR substrate-binding domain-containing protein, partial [Bosea sp. (in: a-proteobacteria)]